MASGIFAAGKSRNLQGTAGLAHETACCLDLDGMNSPLICGSVAVCWVCCGLFHSLRLICELAHVAIGVLVSWVSE